MTQLEKLVEIEGLKDTMEFSAFNIASNDCPSDHGMIDMYKCKDVNKDVFRIVGNCVKCWLQNI